MRVGDGPCRANFWNDKLEDDGRKEPSAGSIVLRGVAKLIARFSLLPSAPSTSQATAEMRTSEDSANEAYEGSLLR